MSSGGVQPVGIVGWGSTSALGPDTASAVARLRRGERGLARARHSPHLGLLADGIDPLLGEVPLDLDEAERPRAVLFRALDEALAMAAGRPGGGGPASGGGPQTIGVFAGTTVGWFVEGEVELLRKRRADPQADTSFAQPGPGAVAEAVAARLGATGPVLTFTMACTSSAAALAAAGRQLRAGRCDRAVVVGYDLLSCLTISGFRSLMLFDPEPCRPFDARRAGLQLGEGCGVLVLERGPARFELLGDANVLDPSHLTASATDGSTAERVMADALRSSGLAPGDVVSIKAHGTGTRDNDLAEGRGIARLFGGSPPPFASLKGALGHTLGAAGSLEVALWLGCLAEGFLPASIGFEQVDPEIGLQPLREPRQAPRGAHLFGAFGFGGSCVAVVIRDGSDDSGRPG